MHNRSMEENRITIKDIAEELGISTATVSNVLHGKKNKVSKSTIEKVEACIERRNYIPSMAALLLGRNDSRIVAVIINDHEKYHGHVLEDGFVSASLNALSKALEEKGLFMMVKITKDITEVPTYASMWNMDALVLIGFCDSDYASLRRESRIPFVVYDGMCEMDDEEIVMLTVDNRKGGLLAGEYLYDMGHRSVLCITDNHWRMDEDRCNGVIEKVGKGEELMIPIDKDERWKLYKEKMDYILSFSSVFAISDFYALDFMAFMEAEGKRIPQDISLIGFDGSLSAQQFNLTTITQDHIQRAYYAVESLEEFRRNEMKNRVKVVDVSLKEGLTVRRLCD